MLVFFVGFGKRALLEKGSFQKSPFSRDSGEFRDSRDSREPPECRKQRRVRAFSRDSREFRDFRDSRDSSSEKTPFVMTPFSGPFFGGGGGSANFLFMGVRISLIPPKNL